MAFSLIAHTSKSSTGTSSSINTTGANLLVALVSWSKSTTAITLTDSKSNSWTRVSSFRNANTASIYYAENASVGSGHTFTTSGGASGLCVAAFSGATTTFVFDRAVFTSNAGTGTSQNTGSLTPPINNCLMIAGLSYRDTTTVSVNSGFTITDQVAFNSGVAVGAALAYLIQTSATAENPTFSWTNTAGCQAMIMTFQSVTVAVETTRGFIFG